MAFFRKARTCVPKSGALSLTSGPLLAQADNPFILMYTQANRVAYSLINVCSEGTLLDGKEIQWAASPCNSFYFSFLNKNIYENIYKIET